MPQPKVEPEPPVYFILQDMWEGEQWESFGKGVALLIPILLVGGAIVGGFAANTYNQGAECGVTLCSLCFAHGLYNVSKLRLYFVP